jgi:two-component system NtrC family sensor kinase
MDPDQATELRLRILELERQLKEMVERLSAAESRLERADGLATVGALVAEVAHEINTPLAGIRGNIDLLGRSVQRLRNLVLPPAGELTDAGKERSELFPIIESALRTSQLACERVVNIVEGLRRFNRPDDGQCIFANIHDEIEGSLSLLASEFKRRIRVVREFGAVPPIECRPVRIGQVLLNLLVNAVQAINGEGEIRIRTWQEAGNVLIAISDSGPGIPADLRHKIFEPGFTTKSANAGTGLGLFISRRIVLQHGGCIRVESNAPAGATFTVVLPIRQGSEKERDDV